MAAEGDEHKQAKRHKGNDDGALGAVVSFRRYCRLSQVSVVVGIVIMPMVDIMMACRRRSQVDTRHGAASQTAQGKR